MRQVMQGDPSAVISGLCQSNPDFARFVKANMGRSPKEAFEAYGYDFDEVARIVDS